MMTRRTLFGFLGALGLGSRVASTQAADAAAAVAPLRLSDADWKKRASACGLRA